MNQAAKDKLAQHEAEEKRKVESAKEKPKAKQEQRDEDLEEEDPDFADDEHEKAIMQRMMLERMQESGPKKKKGDRDTEGVGREALPR